MNYPLACDCGVVQQVDASAAGTSIHCVCGREIEVPPLHKLKAAIGEESLSPDLRIGILLSENGLPLTKVCGQCKTPTDRCSQVHVTCERPEVRRPGWRLNPIMLLFGWIWLSRGEAKVLGRDVAFHLPLRVCERCAAAMGNTEARAAMLNEPDYARLLQKYPHAAVGFIRGG